MQDLARPRWTLVAGLFFITLATLMHEILLTRIFSVALWYHFAFIALSVAMFGMTAGAILVYLKPKTFTVERAPQQLALSALGYSVSLILSTALFLALPIDASPDLEVKKLLIWAASYLIISVPFVFSGLVVAVALTRFPAHLNRLYAADLVGAALGCLLFVVVLPIVGGATTVVAVAALGAVGATLFAFGLDNRKLVNVSGALTAALVVLTAWHGVLEHENHPFLEIRDAVKNRPQNAQYIRWNSHSRVAVYGDPKDGKMPAPGWGFSQKTEARNTQVRAMIMAIDTFAATPITAFDGNIYDHFYLKDEVVNMAHHVRKNADVAVVGVGGGRDVLSALVFEQKSVFGIEINADVLGAITGPFADYSGYLGRDPRVTLVNDEARSALTRTERSFDIIQLSLIDTFAATAAGAFVLAENGLYTADAWTIFLRKLKPNGILTVSRWFYPGRPSEALRLASLARESLVRSGVQDPRKNVVMIKVPLATGPAGQVGSGVANIFVSPSPFSKQDLEAIRKEAEPRGFEIVVSPEEVQEPAFATILSKQKAPAFIANFPLDLSAPTDDRPFFFHMLRLTDAHDTLVTSFLDPNHGQLKAVRLLVVLLGVVGALTLLCLVVPLALTTNRRSLRGSGGLLVYFFAIGLGFMFVEMASMQRLMVMLGHPTYALSVVLFTILLGTGVGSLLSPMVVREGRLSPLAALGLLVVVLILTGLAIPSFAEALAGATTPVRILSSSVLLFALGLLLGMPFPLGMRAAEKRAPGLMPWLWGLNGAASVLCTVAAAAIALSAGISAAFWCGVAVYVVALGSLAWEMRAVRSVEQDARISPEADAASALESQSPA
ncbi:MAG TPA: hypothetical protein VK524_29840 [Polyangiaceae bacterium]|nr:hypothetical protein [Polyangiaceae bacterium]